MSRTTTLLAVLVCGQACAGASVFVSSEFGDDGAGTGSASHPFKSISAALNGLARIGADNITLLPGRYEGPLNTNLRVGESSNTVRIVSQNGPFETFVGSSEDYRVFQIGGEPRNGVTSVSLPIQHVNGSDDASTSSIRDPSWANKTPNMFLSGITIIGGRASRGGAIFVEGGVLKVLNCRVSNGGHGAVYVKGNSSVLFGNTVFTANGAKNASAENQLKSGGALYIEDGTVHCDSCRFVNNTAIDHGGAIYAVAGTLRLSSSNFTLNRALKGGGGAVFYVNTSPQCYLVSTRFFNNSAVRGGALFVAGASTPQLVNCSLYRNTASHMGGALLTGDTAVVGIKRSSFVGNTADKAGGAIACTGESSVVLSLSFINRNKADLGGAVYTNARAAPQFLRCVILENVANSGAGFFAADESRPVVTKSELSQNNAARGGALYADDSCRPRFVDCRFKNNFASLDGGALYGAFDAALDFEECHFVDNTSNLGDPFHLSPGAQRQVKFTMCSVFPHPNHFDKDLSGYDGFAAPLHVW
eukprot:c4916_g1_i1.p1 GENE.c4916_g1_i1~~c4916_g1_i1.p1  ORF type:complete len:531 (+),score=105.70 c4916_g1_i1:3-1595(+)